MASTQLQRQSEDSEPYSAISPFASPVSACIAAITSYFKFSGPTAQKRSLEEDSEDQDTEANRRRYRRIGSPYTQWYKRMRLLTT